ncbi:MAG TPA: DNA-directed RNA polymerase subunit omega [Myxococcota bacterium]|nr:DNA-directed RNA polymerase subunit omega [Myxococcota bacterium]HPB51221.1 DNA-directed RNA polymerase subunit omega [Myxococcota bacterium]HQP96336.1 DNA-directed RNA polymerase subunit omega [Myxococcota bacterium]
MARVTVEDCLDNVTNRFALCILAARRARALLDEAEPLVETSNREAVTALREIADGKIGFRRDVREMLRLPAHHTHGNK